MLLPIVFLLYIENDLKLYHKQQVLHRKLTFTVWIEYRVFYCKLMSQQHMFWDVAEGCVSTHEQCAMVLISACGYTGWLNVPLSRENRRKSDFYLPNICSNLRLQTFVIPNACHGRWKWCFSALCFINEVNHSN